MRRSKLGRWGLIGLLVVNLGAAPAPPSYQAVERQIQRIERAWQELSPEQNPHGDGWTRFFTTLRGELRRYAEARDADTRVAALGRIGALSRSLDGSRWSEAIALRDQLRAWLAPRVALAWAEYRLLEALPKQSSDPAQRAGWKTYIEQTLRPAVREVEASRSVAARVGALDKLNAAVIGLDRSINAVPWSKAVALAEALRALYDAPNVEVTVDAPSVLAAIGPQGIVEAGPIFFRGQWSYVTPGQILGAYFIPTPDGIHVAIRQALTSVTPIRGFQEQIAADQRGQRAARMYYFSATTRNDAVLTMTALFRLATGLQLAPGYQHGVSAAISSTPMPGGGFGRAIAGLLGFGQRRITNEVYENAIPRMRSEVVSGSQELSAIRTSESAARLNAQIRQNVPDAQTLRFGDFALTGVRLETFPSYASITGMVATTGSTARGASAPQPTSFRSVGGGITADVHLPSALDTAVPALLQSARARDVTNVVVEAPPAGQPNPPGPQVQTNVEFPDFLQRIKDQRAEGRQPQVLRLQRPSDPPRFAADAAGNLVVLVPDFTLDVPALTQTLGEPAQVYRIKSDQAEIDLQPTLEIPQDGGAPRLRARIVDVDFGRQAQVLAINESEDQARPLNALASRVVLVALGNRLTRQTIDVPIEALSGGRVRVVSASKVDPAGWMRVVLTPMPGR
jgi:hypothetical protein